MNIAEEIVNAEHRLWQAIVDDDLGAMGQILSDELVWVHAARQRDSKASFMSSLPHVRYRDAEKYEEVTRHHGRVAILTGLVAMRLATPAQETHRAERFTNIWSRIDKGWRLVASQWTAAQLPEKDTH